MCETKMIKDELSLIIQRLEDAIEVCYTAPKNPREQGYPFATGYSRSAMQATVESLRQLM